MVVLETAVSMFIVTLIAYGLYLYSVKVTKSFSRKTREKVLIYACGEDITEKEALLADRHLYITIWNEVFKPLYDSLRGKVHTGILNDWFFWMFMALIIAYAVIIMLGGASGY